MPFDINEKRFTSDEAATAAGCRPGTLRQWRFRHDLLGGVAAGDFSLVDVCVVRAVQVLTTSRANVSDAITAALDADLRAQITILLSEDEPFSTLFGYHLNDSNAVSAYVLEPEDLPNMMAKTNGVMVLLDVQAVIDHVRKALNVTSELK